MVPENKFSDGLNRISKLFRNQIITRSNSSSEGWSKNSLKKFLYKTLLKLPDQVLVNSYQFKLELDKKFGIKSIVIYNPLNKSSIILQKKQIKKLKQFQQKKC